MRSPLGTKATISLSFILLLSVLSCFCIKNVKASSIFGQNNLGSDSTLSLAKYLRGTVFSVGDTCKGISITVALKKYSVINPSVKCMIYRHSDLALIGQTEKISLTDLSATIYKWKTFTFVSEPTFSPDSYILVAWTSGSVYMSSSNLGGSIGHYKNQGRPNGAPNPLVNPVHDDNQYSIYCTYDVVTKAWHTLEEWNWNLATRQWINIQEWSFNLLSREWNIVELWNFSISTKAWQNIETWAFNLTTRQWNNLQSFTFNILTKGWHEIEQWLFSLDLSALPDYALVLICLAVSLFLVFFAPSILREIEKVIGFRFPRL